jgi:hypothetical protein
MIRGRPGTSGRRFRLGLAAGRNDETKRTAGSDSRPARAGKLEHYGVDVEVSFRIEA